MTQQRGDHGGGWLVRWRDNGRQRSRKFELKRDAEAFDREIKRRQQLGPLAVQQLTTRGPSLGDYIADHWMPEHGAYLEKATTDRYANVYELHIAPALGAVPIGEITAATLRAWQAALLAGGAGHGTVHKARAFLSGVLRHAAESDVIAGNPVAVVRAPKAPHRDAVRPLPPREVEAIRAAILAPAPREVPAAAVGQRQRRRYELPAPGTPATRLRDALIVSIMAYAGLRPGELRALRFEDIGESTLKIERAADPEGKPKPTKTGQRRTVKLLAPLAQDLRAFALAEGRPPASRLLLLADDGRAWDKSDWNMWLQDRWRPACHQAGLSPAPRPYDLRHSFASLMMAQRHQESWVARQLGHSVAMLQKTYWHLIAEYEEAERVDATAEILAARHALTRTGARRAS